MINAAIIGTGNISSAHIEGLLTFPERCRIAALCDIYPEKAKAVKEKYGLDCPVFSDHKSMLKSGIKFDLIHVCTPPYVHAQIAVDSMDAGCNVLVEKPMAACLAECDEMLEAEKRNNVLLACVAQNRFRNSVYKLKKAVDSGIAGKLCFAQIESAWWRGHCYYDLWWRGTWEKEGGGPTLNHAVHHIDMLNWIEGKLPDSVIAMMTNVMHDNSEVEDLSVACLHYSDRSMAQITSSVVHHGEEQGIVLQCADAKLSSSWNVKAEISQSNGFPCRGGNTELKKRLDDFYNGIPDLTYEGHTGEIDDVLKALETNGSPLITGIDGRKTVEVITAIYIAGFLGHTVQLPILKEDVGYKFDDILKYAIHFYEKKEFLESLG
ncbi:MAG: Gfo/Idh/MocA family oxidoreductase [Oscillospiraceae bacterium]|nr:Gfo/Idh/MocA family oxidoreductase [Oscillospiraceae bacterium]